MAETEDAQPRRGRPRDRDLHEKILSVTRAILREARYPGLTIEGVAARAGTSKATIYRWWPTKGDLVLEAAADEIAIGVVPDTGNTRADLLAAARQLTETFSKELAGIVIFAAIANLDSDPAMASKFRQGWVMRWRESAAAAIERGIQRGDLAVGTDVNFTLDVIVGTVFQRTLVVPEPRVEGLPEAIVGVLLG